DECTNGPNDCDVNFECVNTPGSFTCECPTGYEINEGNCEDINECISGDHNCDEDANFMCSNTPGSFECLCLPGYKMDEEGGCAAMQPFSLQWIRRISGRLLGRLLDRIHRPAAEEDDSFLR
ncbi:Hemicentin-2, partial [Geodia barretti]